MSLTIIVYVGVVTAVAATGMYPEKVLPEAIHGASNVDWTTEWLFGANWNWIISPTAALMSFGANARVPFAPPTLTTWTVTPDAVPLALADPAPVALAFPDDAATPDDATFATPDAFTADPVDFADPFPDAMLLDCAVECVSGGNLRTPSSKTYRKHRQRSKRPR